MNSNDKITLPVRAMDVCNSDFNKFKTAVTPSLP